MFNFIFLISWDNVINIKISTTKLPLRHVPPLFFNAIYVPLIEYHSGICSARMVPISQSAHRLRGKERKGERGEKGKKRGGGESGTKPQKKKKKKKKKTSQRAGFFLCVVAIFGINQKYSLSEKTIYIYFRFHGRYYG